MTNVGRHAAAEKVRVTGRLMDHRLQIDISDDGVGTTVRVVVPAA